MADEDFADEKVITDGSIKATKTSSLTEGNTKPLMYVGPNIPKLGMERYTVYKGKLPPIVTEAINKIPEIEFMLIPVDDLINFTRKILNPSSPERRYIGLIQRKIKTL